MSDADAEASEQHGGGAFDCEVDGTSYRVRLVESDPDAYDAFYNVIANPMLWFIQHYLWDLSNAPDIRRNEVDAYEQGYTVVNDDLANAVLDEIEDRPEAVVMLHDYHLYTAPRTIRAGAPRRLPAPLRPHPVDAARTRGGCCRATSARTSSRASSRTTSSRFHTRHYRSNFLLCCRELFDLEVDEEAGVVQDRRPRGVGARLPAADLGGDVREVGAAADRAPVRARDPAPPARAHDPARRPRRPVEERAARLHRVRPVPGPAPRVPASR